MKYTVDELIEALQVLSSEGHGAKPVLAACNPVYLTDEIYVEFEDALSDGITEWPPHVYIAVDRNG